MVGTVPDNNIPCSDDEATIDADISVDIGVTMDLWHPGEIIDGRYRVEGIIGEGGMGAVYRVRHLQWNIDLAVKVVLGELLENRLAKERFVREAETWIKLGLHPNIVQCWFYREFGGTPRLFIDFIEGGTLKEWMRNETIAPGDWSKITDLTIQACDGLAYAHSKGVIHRDIKPANLLMTHDGRLCVSDFGLVKLAGTKEIESDAETFAGFREAGHSVTLTNSMVGTPEYGAPEQWENHAAVDHRIDIYALGVTLFEMLTGRRPFDEGLYPELPENLIHYHVSVPAPDPRDFNPDVPETLALLTLKCLEKEPDLRPPTADDLRASLAKIYMGLGGDRPLRQMPKSADQRADGLNNRGVSMIEIGQPDDAFAAWGEALKLEASHPEAVYNRTISLWRRGSITDDAAVARLREARASRPETGLYLGYLHSERNAADEAEKEIVEALKNLSDVDAATRVALADSLMAQSRFEEAAAAYDAAKTDAPDDAHITESLAMAQAETRISEERLLFPWNRLRTTLTDHKKGISAAAISADGTVAVTADMGGTIYVWETATCNLTKTMTGHEWAVPALALAHDGTNLLSASWDGSVRCWNLASGEEQKIFQGEEGLLMLSATLSPDASLAIAGGADKKIRVWRLQSDEPPKILEGHDAEVTCLAVTPNGDYLVSGDARGGLLRWRLDTGQQVTTLATGDGEASIEDIALSSDDDIAFTGGSDGSLRVWSLDTGEIIETISGGGQPIKSVALIPKTSLALSSGLDQTIRLWDLDTLVCRRTFTGHCGSVDAIAVASDTNLFISGSQDKEARIWQIEAGEPGHSGALIVNRVKSHHGAQESGALFREHLKQANAHCRAGQFDSACVALTTAQKVPGYEQDPEVLTLKAALSIILPLDGLRALWRVRSARATGEISAMALSPSGKRALTAESETNQFALISLQSAKILRSFPQQNAPLSAACLLNEGQSVLTAGRDGVVRRWQSKTGEVVWSLDGYAGALALSADESMAIYETDDQLLKLIDTTDGTSIGDFAEPVKNIEAAAFSPDGNKIVTGGWDKILRVWQRSSGKCLLQLEGHEQEIKGVAIAPDGLFALSCGLDKTVRYWDITSGNLLQTIATHTDWVVAVAISPDGRFSISASYDKTVRIFDLKEKKQIYVSDPFPEVIYQMRLTPNGRYAAFTGLGGFFQVWELDWLLSEPVAKPD